MYCVRLPLTFVLGALSVLCIAPLVGCGGKPAGYPDTAPVTGTVTLDGQPVEQATITFTPTGGGRPSIGKTDSSGRYELSYTGTIPGAVLGTHRVEIQKMISDPKFVPPTNVPEGLDGEAMLIAPEIHFLPENYRGRDSELSNEVKDDDNVFDFALTSD